MVDRILVGVDGSEGSRRALRWAMGEAVARRTLLQPVTVWQSPYDLGEMLYLPVDEEAIATDAKLRLDGAIAEAAGTDPAPDVDPLVLHGDPAQVLCESSADAALLVVGSRGRSGLAGVMLGSVSTKCAHHSRCPLVIVPHGDREDENRALGQVTRILVGVDGSEGSRRALRWAIEEAAVRGASVDAVAVWQDPYRGDMTFEYEIPYLRRDRRATLEHVDGKLAEAVAEVVGHDPVVEVDPLVVEGDPAETLCERSAGADLLVVGSRGHGGFARLMLGSVSSACAHRSRCPIAIVPADGREHQARTDR